MLLTWVYMILLMCWFSTCNFDPIWKDMLCEAYAINMVFCCSAILLPCAMLINLLCHNLCRQEILISLAEIWKTSSSTPFMRLSNRAGKRWVNREINICVNAGKVLWKIIMIKFINAIFSGILNYLPLLPDFIKRTVSPLGHCFS